MILLHLRLNAEYKSIQSTMAITLKNSIIKFKMGFKRIKHSKWAVFYLLSILQHNSKSTGLF